LRRFIVPFLAVNEDTVTIAGDQYHHIVHVLRLKKGSRLSLADGCGREYDGIISKVDGDSLTVALAGEPVVSKCGNMPRITLYQGLPKGEKLELIMQKCTELGVSEIVPFMAARSVARVGPGRLEEKLERWRRITLEAARQSKRAMLPEINFAADVTEVCRHADHDIKLLLWEEEHSLSMKRILSEAVHPASVAVVVGPEGGLTPYEVAIASKYGFISVSLGRRILRTETAGLAIMAILQFYWGDLG
jgi:16S rRNA (uracil1498-N3)-methyltransferase